MTPHEPRELAERAEEDGYDLAELVEETDRFDDLAELVEETDRFDDLAELVEETRELAT